MSIEHGQDRLSLVSDSGLAIEASTDAADGVLDEFYEDYDRAFVLEDEKESYGGFVDCLALNSGAAYERLASQFGLFREIVLVARDPRSGARVGGVNFIAFPIRRGVRGDGLVLSINLNYVFVNPPQRGKGFFRRLVSDLPALATKLFHVYTAAEIEALPSPVTETRIFIEQNDPYRMSRETYDIDTRFSGIDQMERIAIWARLGAKIIDFPYVQPPLTLRQQPDGNLVYGVLGEPGATLSACLLHDHLQRFFGISVLKGAELNSQPVAAAQLDSLAAMCSSCRSLQLLEGSMAGAPHPLLASPGSRPASLRDYLRH